MAAQVEAVALQSLVKGSPNVRVGTFAAQVLAAGARTVEVEAFAVQVLTPVIVGATEVSGVAAAVTIAGPVGVVSASSVVSDATLAAAAAAGVTVDAPNGALSIVSGGSVSLTGAPTTVTLDAPGGTVAAGVSVGLSGPVSSVTTAAPAGVVGIGKNFDGPVSRVNVAAPAGQVFAGVIPSVVETVRLAGVTGTMFTLPFTETVQPGDVVVVGYIGNITSYGSRIGSLVATGMGGTWDQTPANPITPRTESIWVISTDVTTTGNVTVTVDKNLDPLIVGLLIRGTNGYVATNPYQTDSVYQMSGIGEAILVMASTKPTETGLLDLVNFAAQPSEAAWTETLHYQGTSGTDRQLVFAVPDHSGRYSLDPYETTGNTYKLEPLIVGQAELDANVSATNSASVTLRAPAGSVDARVEFEPLKGGGVLTLSAGSIVDFVVMTETVISGGGTVTLTGDALSVAVMPNVTIAGGGTVIARPVEVERIDPRRQGPQWNYRITGLDNVPIGELTDIEHDPVEDGVGEPGTMQFSIATDSDQHALIKPIERQCQVWEGDVLRLRGPILPGRPSDDGTVMTYQIHDPSWFWRDGRRVITRTPQKNLLHNGDFKFALSYWTRGYDSDSIPKAAPNVRVVSEDFTDDTDGLDPIKAAEIFGVESVTESELSSNAVFWPNLATFRPGGKASIEKVADDMPTTAGLKVTVIGHTANDGTGNGLVLSKRRADAAAAIIHAKRPGAVITTKGVGFYDPKPGFPIGSQEQRRVVIQYDQTITGKSKQWMRQTVEVTQPKEARYPLVMTAAAMLKVADDWSVPDANMTSVKVVVRRKGAAKPLLPWDEQLGVGSASISDTDPIDRWIPQTAEATVPADGRTYLVDVYLYAPAAQARYTAVGLFPEEQLYFWGQDQALIFKGVMEHIQDPAFGYADLGVATRAPLTGIRRDREWSFRDLTPADTALDGLMGVSRGLEWDTVSTATTTTATVFYPRQGQSVDYVLALGSNVVAAVPANTRDVGSAIIAQAQGLGSYRAVAYATDARAFGGTKIQRVITAEQDAPLNELRETAKAELFWAKSSTPAYWVDIDPDSIAEVLANTAKGDTVRLILDYPTAVDRLARIVRRQIHPDSLRLMLAFEEV